ncbi:MAG TPA: GNAT family N-acetyltransferase [Paludibacter sp.]|nr:GNAT family N-acetyltransferase [Paludibacter sp.]
MILLHPNDYHKVTDILNKVEFNNYFAKSVVLQYVTGKIYVDKTENPTVIYIFHPYGMSLLLGDYTNVEFNSEFRNYCLNTDRVREKADWLQVQPLEWCAVIEDIAKTSENIIEQYERLNFKFNREKYLAFRKTIDLNNWEIVETNAEIFDTMPGTVVPRYFWDNVTDFMSKSKSYTLIINNQAVSTAFAAYLLDKVLEIGIQTVDGHYGKEYSAISCCKLIDYCLENELEPVWACKGDNIGSIKLAQKLGFEKARTGPYYKINF